MSKEVVCHRCGTVDDYYTQQAGPHVKAICNNCNRYIKFMPQNLTKIFSIEEIKMKVNSAFDAETANKIINLFIHN